MPAVKISDKCSKCGGKVKQEELSMYGRYGAMGRAYRFLATICQECGYTELYYWEKTAWV
jgi:predicted nucleic-acid-binding Zn-ribbon protein